MIMQASDDLPTTDAPLSDPSPAVAVSEPGDGAMQAENLETECL